MIWCSHSNIKRCPSVRYCHNLRQKSRLQTTDAYGTEKTNSTDQQADGAETGLSNAEPKTVLWN